MTVPKIRAPVLMTLALLPGPAFAACEEPARVPLVVSTPEAAKDGSGGTICVWRTKEPWQPPAECGNRGFEVVGWGAAPAEVVFKRNNTYYAKTWATRPAEAAGDDPPAWTSATLDRDGPGNRCAVGWCEPTTYVLRTASAADDAVCGQRVEMHVRMTDVPD